MTLLPSSGSCVNTFLLITCGPERWTPWFPQTWQTSTKALCLIIWHQYFTPNTAFKPRWATCLQYKPTEYTLMHSSLSSYVAVLKKKKQLYIHTSRNAIQSRHICPCISNRLLQLQTHGPGSSVNRTHIIINQAKSHRLIHKAFIRDIVILVSCNVSVKVLKPRV